MPVARSRNSSRTNWVPVVVVNKPGASGVLGAKEVACAAPDGYTLGIFSTGFLTAHYTVPTPTDVNDYSLMSLINMDPAVIAVERTRMEKLQRARDLWPGRSGNAAGRHQRRQFGADLRRGLHG